MVGAALLLRCALNGAGITVLGRTKKAQAIQSLEADKPPDVDGALTRDFRKHVRDLLTYKSGL